MKKESISKTRIAACYIRVSTDKQEELSPASQKKLLLEYASKHHMLLPEENIFLEDGGISGKKAEKRLIFQKMICIARSEKKPFDVILVWKYSRFARNQEESIVYKNMLAKEGIEVISISEPLTEGPYGSLIERIIEWMDEYYSTNLAGEVFRGMKENALRGNYQSSPPLGYYLPYPHAILQVNPEEAKIVKLIFEKFCLESKTAFEIARDLNRLGLKTKLNKAFETRGVQYILQNPIYIGKIRWNRTSHETQEIKSPSEWILENGKQEAIIPEELFNTAQKRIKKNTFSQKRPSSIYKYWFSGLIKCSACGSSLTCSFHYRTKNMENIYYFQCHQYLKGKCQISHYISGKYLIPVILQTLHYNLDFISADYKFISSKVNSIEKNEFSLLRQQLEKCEKKAERIKSAYENGIDTIEEYKKNKESLKQEKENLTRQLQRLEFSSLASASSTTHRNILDIIEDETISTEVKNNALKTILSKMVFDKRNSQLKIYFFYS